jgi:peptidyl-prolyl cis-trans isomerase B (cyclophilin B)
VTPTKGTATLLMSTNQGDLTLTLDRSKAPCAAASFVFLTQKKFFDGSPCHREVNQPTFGVLQCGDPTGTGAGGPTYNFRQETTPRTSYPRGTIAMANSGQPNSTSSQFFLCFTDTQLQPDYTAVGTVDPAGLAVLDKIAAAGNDGSLEASAGGGKPKLPVTITSMTVVS